MAFAGINKFALPIFHILLVNMAPSIPPISTPTPLSPPRPSVTPTTNTSSFWPLQKHLLLIPHLAKGLSPSDWIYDLAAQAGLSSHHM